MALSGPGRANCSKLFSSLVRRKSRS